MRLNLRSSGPVACGAAVLIASALALTGCGGSSSEAGSAPGTSSAGTAARTTAAGAPAASAVSGPEFCAALKAEQPKLEQVGNPDAAFVQLTLALVDLYESKGAVETMDASTMDALAASCPADAAKALKSAGKSSFAEFR
jgi:hypothetical protein